MQQRRFATALLLILALLAGAALVSSSALAASGRGAGGTARGKPPTATPTPGSAPQAEGVVYYADGGASGNGVWFINADGTGATQTDSGVKYSPSGVQHGGKRWLVQYGADSANGTYPNGQARGLLLIHGVDANGNEVATVTFVVPADLELNGMGLAKWLDDPSTSTADGLVTWPARRWDLNANPPEVVEAGVYTAEVTFDGTTGDVTGIDGNSVSLAVPVALQPATSGGQGECYTVGGGWFGDVWQADWRPDGSQVVYTRCSDAELVVSDAGGLPSTHQALGDIGRWPDWSAGASSLVVYEEDQGSIRTIDPNASNPASTVTTIVAAKTKGKNTYINQRPVWSPTGDYIAFGRYFGTQGPSDLLYIPASGGTETLLDDLGRYPTGWVEGSTP